MKLNHDPDFEILNEQSEEQKSRETNEVYELLPN